MFGAGLLVGTALAVIIPEGVEAMYDVHPHSDSSDKLVKGTHSIVLWPIFMVLTLKQICLVCNADKTD